MPAAKREAAPARPVWAKDLDDREYRFVCEYLVDLNRTQAVLRSGITDNYDSARAIGSTIASRMKVAVAIDVAMGEQAAGPRQWIIGKLSNIARGNISEFFKVNDEGEVVLKSSKDVPREVWALVKRIHRNKDGEVRLELHDPLRAMELLGKVGSIALLREKLEVEGGLTLDMLIRESYEGKKEGQK